MRSVVIHSPHELRVEHVPDETMGPGQVTVAVKAGGTCGSDMHYYRHGGFGTVREKQPMVLGHEASGLEKQTFRSAPEVAVQPYRPPAPKQTCLSGVDEEA